MSSIRERTVLCLADLPKKLTSRRNLLAHFSKFGVVKDATLNKQLRTAIVKFGSHFEAQAAKTQGTIFEGDSLTIFWSEASSLDPRSKEKPELPVCNDDLWQDDDKESFGVKVVQPKPRTPGKMSAGSLIAQHLKPSTLKRKVAITTKPGESTAKKGLISLKTVTKSTKTSPKTSISLKKSALAQSNKLKLLRKEGTKSKNNKLVPEVDIEENIPKSTIIMTERMDLKMKLDLLDERDKAIRLETVKESDLKTAVSMKGTCPDMCPERERIMRQFSHSVAMYEMVPGTSEMDENKAVKEYTRSSADQEVPLPHDLRPEPVLSMTMNYLITQIVTRIDNVHENKAVWYSFCWNRLRSIRKDIILQQLCDMETVKIVEQCARYHIVCYDHMWGADVSGFDDKLNTQILNDCLQTLKHMYEDLAKQNITCPNEAEFYSYFILLKLKSGDVMWEYQQYAIGIQLSPQVQFAIEAYMAFKNNMYSRYFSLVKNGTYLAACLMQRYFDQVRVQALKSMVKAYCLPNRTVGLPSSFVEASLKFDCQYDAMSFCEREGVDVKVNTENIEPRLDMDASSFLIREKRIPIAIAVVGEGNPLPVYTPHKAISSFNESGQLKTSLSFTSDEEESKITDTDINEDSFYSDIDNSENITPEKNKQTFKFSLSPVMTPENIFATTIFSSQPVPVTKEENTSQEIRRPNEIGFPPLPLGSNVSSIPEMGEAFDDNMEVDDSKKEYVSVPVQSSNTFSFNLSPQQTSNLVCPPTTTKPFFSVGLPDSGPTSYPKPQQFSNFFLPSTQLEEKKDISNTPSVKLNDVGKESESGLLEENQLYEVKSIQVASPISIEIEKEEMCQLEKLLREKAEEERLRMEQIKKEEMERQRKRLEEKRALEALRKNVGERMKAKNARKCVRMWREKVKQIKIQRSKANFPMLVPLSVQDHLSIWGSVNEVSLHSITQRMRYRLNISRITSEMLSHGLTESCKYLGSELADTIARSSSKAMRNGGIRPIYWKLVVSVPCTDKGNQELSVFNKSMKRWFKQALYRKASSQIGSVEQVMTSLRIPVNMSVQFVDNVDSCHTSQGMDALVFIVSNDAETEKMCLRRLRSLVNSQEKKGDISVAVMNVGGNRIERVLKVELEELYEQKLISHWTINQWEDPESIVDGLTFLAQRVSTAPHISACSLELLLKETSEDFFDSLSCGQHSNPGLRKAMKDPNNAIRLYNLCLTKLEDLLISKKLEKYFNIAKEFEKYIPQNEHGGPELLCGVKFDEVYKTHISKKIFEARLSELEDWPPRSIDSLVDEIKSYCSEFVHNPQIFPQIIRMLAVPNEGDVAEYLNSVSWLDIVEIWAECRILHCFSGEVNMKQVSVLYNKYEVQALTRKPWWLKLPVVTNALVTDED